MVEPITVVFQPIGRRVKVQPGSTILSAAQAAGVQLAAVCGGEGTCLECRIRVQSGEVTPPTQVEQDVLAEGLRLACQARLLGNSQVHIPPESLTATQRLQLEGDETFVELQPAVHPPEPEDPFFGLAVDVGTTKLAAYLVDLHRGETVARAGAMNPQVAYGEDVINRIVYATQQPNGGKRLQSILIEALNGLVVELCSSAKIPRDSIQDAVMVGNTAMGHLLAALPVHQLGVAPYAPAETRAMHLAAEELGLHLGPGAQVYLPPVIAGYVGADHLAMLIATGAWKSEEVVIALDIGTNTEISLVAKGRITCCSCASGPAFEGAHIHDGMRAAPGAIERARWLDGKVLWQSIDDLPPVGICGSGILDVVAALLDGGLLRVSGALRLDADASTQGFLLVPAAKTGIDRDLVVTRKDIHEIQLAKSAIRSGCEVLLRQAGLTYNDIQQFIVAGAFGTYLDLRSAVRVGMFPPLPMEHFQQVGNAAGVGARQMLVSMAQRRKAEDLARQPGYIELTTDSGFTEIFIQNLNFGGEK